MEQHLPAPSEHTELVLDTVHDLHPDHHDPQRQQVQQNLAAGILPLALVAFVVLVLVAVAWTLVVGSAGPGV